MLERHKWLNTATAKIRFGPDRKAVRKELENHLEDIMERQTAAGLPEEEAEAAALPEEEAEAAALNAMGDPESIAGELGRLHRPWWGYLWRASQTVLAGAAAGYLLLVVLLAVRGSFWLLPGRQLYHYLTWESAGADGVLEEQELLCREQVETGGYTIRVRRAALRDYGTDGWGQCLHLELDISLSRWEEGLYVWNALSGVRSDSGEITDFWAFANDAVWGFWQKAEMIAAGLPEDAQWLELDFGYGELRRTMRIDLTEVAET